ncbi:DUF2889 domain-containing protein [Actinocorallia populi]|uniref:DUF2889 domain-containing protein n=1 Tax=Actinocorallia populi TaxID=2079200 RepID=UPI000D08F381|nr:DUF2889 domain-containing protein [Actinocorallia populi]
MTTIPDEPLVLHPRHGIHEPTSGTPVRRPGTVRRTVTTDMLRPEGVQGPLVLRLRGRDLRTGPAGEAELLAEASGEAVVDYHDGKTLLELRTDPARPALAELCGRSVASGFRRGLDVLDPALIDECDLLYLLLDDVPVTTLVSGHAVTVERLPGSEIPPERRRHFPADLCAGFVTGGTLISGVLELGTPPVVTGPLAPALDDPDDPAGWHDMDPLPPTGMRRSRRIDVSPARDGRSEAEIEALFRDSYVLGDGRETVIHEYTLTARARDGVVTECRAQARVLPWTECPGAVASAGRIAGVRLDELRSHVRTRFAGVSTCTHLNDMLRSLHDVPVLLGLAG